MSTAEVRNSPLDFLYFWFRAIFKPIRTIDELIRKPSPTWGLWAVLTRFIVTSLTTTLALYLLGRLPFVDSQLTILPIENYYKAEIFFLPFWGLGIWLLMSSLSHIIIRLSGRSSNFDHVLNIIGIGMLVPMPFLWLWDWTSIGLNWPYLPQLAVAHSLSQIWEGSIQAIGFRRIVGLKVRFAIILAIVINVVYILLAQFFIR